MIDINFLRGYSTRLKDFIPAINFDKVIVDDTQMVNFLQDRSRLDNQLLFTVIPDFNPTGTNLDNLQFQSQTLMLVLYKTNYSDISHDEFLDIMQETLLTAVAIKEKMIDDKLNYTAAGCLYMKQLNANSITIKPVWGKAECNGWSIEFNFDS
ncbi:hypothetical protein JJL45_05140 [Tamlana sp. s12]|uniref:hypothetical protein n=1 Tax=Tamlana sp. s12 TaxID=1630406 RepID=UPI0007FE7165|nr:hypothetical protein [Tamlana sp. s12]OBQ56111.1 hypothetical protein VQ01_06920 [Tamlana sp. s12]QQY83376.1 hypothetical protein JJL45_05140 [Tamlana sp. s12]